jgi:hypothetical protein
MIRTIILVQNYYIGVAKQAFEYKATTKFLINSIKQNCKVQQLHCNSHIYPKTHHHQTWKPTIMISKNLNPETKEADNTKLNLKTATILQQQCH